MSGGSGRRLRWLRRNGSALAIVIGAPTAAGAQQPVPLKGRLEPYLASLSRDYPVIGLALRFRQPPDSAARSAYARELFLAAGVTLQGGFRAQSHLRAPGLAPRYRLHASLSSALKARFLFAGLGNASELDRSIEKEGRPDFYSVRRNRTTLRVEVTRWVGARLGVALGLGLDDARFTALPGESVFRSEIGTELAETDGSAGVMVVYDRRDSETIPTRGVLFQAGAHAGAGAGTYQRLVGVAQGYLTLRPGTVLALRAGASGLWGDAPLVARFEVPVWERTVGVFGGDDSHRGVGAHRFVGARVWFANAEAHQDLGTVRRHRISLVGLADAGRVFEDERFTVRGTKVSAGIALALRGPRERLGAALAAVGPDGLRVSLVGAWPF